MDIDSSEDFEDSAENFEDEDTEVVNYETDEHEEPEESEVSAPAKKTDSKPVAEKSAPTKQEAKPSKEISEEDLDRMVKLKIDGEEKIIPLREALKISGLEQASYKRMQAASEEKKTIEREKAEVYRLKKMLDEDPEAYLREKGFDPDQWAEQRVAEWYRKQNLSPEQIELEEYRQMKAAEAETVGKTKGELIKNIEDLVGQIPKELNNLSVEQLKQLHAQQVAQYRAGQEDLQEKFIQAWESTGLPKDPYFGQLMAHTMLREKKLNNRDLSTEEAAVRVKDKFTSHVREVIGKMAPEALTDLLGKETVERLRKHNIERVTGRPASFGKSNGPAPKAASRKAPESMNQYEYREHMSKLIRQNR